jgi:two-component system sensor histidine kinase KdpD
MADQEQFRPDPDALLAAVQREEAREKRGKLKIFFGMSAGVGKTYAMLQAAHELKGRGINVIVGYIETHKRRETEALLEGLTVVPRIKREYKGVLVEEMDLDAILERHPEYVLVDELAHTNAEGSRHAKRYQDVLELLDNNISVYTTLNVQHVESLVDTVRQITGATVYETVPDSVLDIADDIELVDLPPEELLKRLNEGKVYSAERSVAALQNFFREGNLFALREIALRKTAERVGKQLQDYMQVNRIEGPWKTIDRLLVGISPSPYSEQLVRWTRRVASTMEASWIAVYVQTSRTLSTEDEERLKKNITLARELGAEEIITTADEDVANAFLRIARQKNVTQIVVGRSLGNPFLNFFRGGSLVDRLIKKSGDIDVYVAQGARADARAKKGIRLQPRSPVQQYLFAAGVICAVSIACFLAGNVIDYRSVGMFLLFTVSLLALVVGRGPVLLAATLTAFIWDFFFIPPLFTFYISSSPDSLLVVMYFLIALIGGSLTTRIRAKEIAVRRREKQSLSLYALAKEINNADTIDDIVRASVIQIGMTFDVKVACFLRDKDGELSRVPHEASTMGVPDMKEWSVVSWVFENGKSAGQGTSTLPFAEATYYPLLTNDAPIGVIGISSGDEQPLVFEQEVLFQAYLNQIAPALEREILRKDAEQAHVLAESERLYKTLLSSISHELRTPLATITGAASSLMDEKTSDNTLARNMLIGDIHHSAYRLNRLVENLLDMTRLESGMLKLNYDWCDVSDLLNVVTTNLKRELSNHTIKISMPTELPLIKIDFVLIEQAIANILLNAAQYTPAGTTLTLGAYAEAKNVVITVDDEGPGFSQEALKHVFEKFYRAPGTTSGGTGLGLSITRGFIEAHGGSVSVDNRPSGGARFVIRLPISEMPKPPHEMEAA